MVALTHTRADTEIVVAVVVVELSLERHRGLSSGGGDGGPHPQPPRYGDSGSDGGDASPRRTQRYYEE